jgi:hypothetical protein
MPSASNELASTTAFERSKETIPWPSIASKPNVSESSHIIARAGETSSSNCSPVSAFWNRSWAAPTSQHSGLSPMATAKTSTAGSASQAGGCSGKETWGGGIGVGVAVGSVVAVGLGVCVEVGGSGVEVGEAGSRGAQALLHARRTRGIMALNRWRRSVGGQPGGGFLAARNEPAARRRVLAPVTIVAFS